MTRAFGTTISSIFKKNENGNWDMNHLVFNEEIKSCDLHKKTKLGCPTT